MELIYTILWYISIIIIILIILAIIAYFLIPFFFGKTWGYDSRILKINIKIDKTGKSTLLIKNKE